MVKRRVGWLVQAYVFLIFINLYHIVTLGCMERIIMSYDIDKFIKLQREEKFILLSRNKMNVLIACEESQRSCIAFRKRGFRAYSCDIQPCSGGHPEWHIEGDALTILNGGYFTTADGIRHFVPKWDLLIAHPPCTYLSNAGARWLYKNGILNKERYAKGIEAKKFFMSFLNAPIEHIAVENPVPSAIYQLPYYTQIIVPNMFGEEYQKKTCLWLKNLPKLEATNIVKGISTRDAKWFNCGKERQKNRSKTFQCIAEAFATQWGDYIKGD